jgi:CHAD domain-containing protein
LQPRAAIGPAVRAIATHILGNARAAITDPERSNQEAVHHFRRDMKEWRALMRLMEPFIPDALRWRHDARTHARSLGHARDGAAALNAFDTLLEHGMVLSETSIGTIRDRIDLRYQMDLIEPLWPRFGRMWTEEAERLRGRLGQCQDLEVLRHLTGLHQPLAYWRSKLTPAADERSAELAQRAARIAVRLFAERPKAFRHRLEMLWDNAR